MKNIHLVIMAGGIGSRFWPHSTVEHPKQFIDILGKGETMIQATRRRFDGVIPVENTWVVTSERYAEQVHALLPEVPTEQVLLEPCMRNTAPCIAYAAWRIAQIDPDAMLVVTPADQYVGDPDEFRRVMKRGTEFIADSDRILTVGINPERPETGYGYIRAAAADGDTVLPVEAFREKPDIKTACRYFLDGGYYWNSGIFVWNVRTIGALIRRFLPEVAERFDRLSMYFNTPLEQAVKKEVFNDCPAVSIDHGVLEHASDIFVLPASFQWSDLGTDRKSVV